MARRPHLVIQSSDRGMYRYLRRQEAVHKLWANRCGADYRTFTGTKQLGVHPAWNRLPMFLEAFREGYERVLWMDVDTLVVKQDRNIFAEVDSSFPMWMVRVWGSWPEMPWLGGLEEQWDVFNDGVLLCDNTPEVVECLEWVWAQRSEPHLPHHVPSMWELNWLLDYVWHHRELVGELSEIWNWMAFAHACPVEQAVIRAWHGLPREQRWQEFSDTFRAVYR